ncbi:hypothetical protein GQ53DRAFT_806819 [Thozetella sp. PMI_491]|nr:hypothetical protein GQ53DRAFT_806819 [Thozetella sp. PMI_491]
MSVSPTTGMSRLCVPVPSPGAASFFEEDSSVVRLPSMLKYNISNISEKAQDIVRALRQKTPFEDREDPPELVLRTCREYRGQDDWYYTFQILEVVPYSIRIGSPDSQGYATPKCHGPHADDHHKDERRPDSKAKSKATERQLPCKHMVFLMDSLSKHALYDHHPDEELTMMEGGSAAELGDPFEQISKIRLDVLADACHCDTTLPDGETVTAESRTLEAQEILALIAGTTLRDVQDRLHNSYDSSRLIYRGDPLTTLYSLLLASHHLTALVRSQLEPSDPPLDPFLALQRRVDRTISELDSYSRSVTDETQVESRYMEGGEVKHPLDPSSPNVAWAASEIQHCVQHIEALVSRGMVPLADWERDSAVKSLLRILRAVVDHNRDSFPGYTNREISKDDRNLYARLIGNHDNEFVYSALSFLEDHTDYIDDLEFIMQTIEDLDYGSKRISGRITRGIPGHRYSYHTVETGRAHKWLSRPQREGYKLKQSRFEADRLRGWRQRL